MTPPRSTVGRVSPLTILPGKKILAVSWEKTERGIKVIKSTGSKINLIRIPVHLDLR
jgi:hypothetical protein